MAMECPKPPHSCQRGLWFALLVPLSFALVSTAHGEDEASLAPDELQAAIEALLEESEAEIAAAQSRHLVAEDSVRDYDELDNMRVLERELISSSEARVELLEMGFGVPAHDRLALSGEPAVRLLTREREGAAAPKANQGLQLHVNPSLEGALDQVRRDLAPYAAGSQSKDLLLPLGLDCASEPAVQEYLALYTAPGSRTLKVWLQRSGKWRPALTRILEEEGVPSDLFYLAMIESGYRTKVKSPANAAGMWQFIPGTAVDMGLKIDAYVDERLDPFKATRTAARYLKRQKDRFGSWPLAMAAYNGGSGTVSKAIGLYNTNDYFKLVAYGAMYDETRRYVPKILAAAMIAKNPRVFGFDGLVMEPAWTFDEVDVPGGLRLALLADAAGTDLATLEEYNPELLKGETPPGVSAYTLRLPAGSAAEFVERFDRVSELYGKDHQRVRLKFGQTIEMLAAELEVPARLLRQVNGYSRNERAPYGAEIIVPSKALGSDKSAKAAVQKGYVLVPNQDFQFTDRVRYLYHVNAGDKVEEIAQAFDLRPNQIALWNDLDLAAKLRSGMGLQLFLPAGFDVSGTMLMTEDEVKAIAIGSEAHEALSASTRASSPRGVGYSVKRGDTVSSIAKRHGVTVKQIIEWNNLDKNGTIRTGTRLVLYPKK